MTETEGSGETANWHLATWDGSRREALRRWAQLPLERMIAALEEMEELVGMLAAAGPVGMDAPVSAVESAVHGPSAEHAPHEQKK